jgi:hypothetical protein
MKGAARVCEVFRLKFARLGFVVVGVEEHLGAAARSPPCGLRVPETFVANHDAEP